MSPFFTRVIRSFNRFNLDYILAGESLIGLTEGDVIKYAPNLRLYIFPVSIVKLVLLGISLMFQGIFLKPKFIQGRLYYKIRYRPNLFTKDSTFITLTLLDPKDGGYVAFMGGHDTFFKAEDLAPGTLDSIQIENDPIPVPVRHEEFIEKYKEELLAGFYQKHEVAFDSDSEKNAVQFMHRNVEIMKSVGIEFWVEGGTLLGALRDQKLIPWDHDLDFGMKFKSETQMKQLIRELRRHFYVSVKSFQKTDTIWDLGRYRVLKIYPRKYLLLHEALCLDLFVYYKGTLPDSDETVYKYVVWNRNAYHRSEFLDNQDWLKFYNKEVPVPANAEKFIEVKYGENWRTPIKEWNVALDDGSIYTPKA